MSRTAPRSCQRSGRWRLTSGSGKANEEAQEQTSGTGAERCPSPPTDGGIAFFGAQLGTADLLFEGTFDGGGVRRRR